jgi:hypothetical protein
LPRELEEVLLGLRVEEVIEVVAEIEDEVDA